MTGTASLPLTAADSQCDESFRTQNQLTASHNCPDMVSDARVTIFHRMKRVPDRIGILVSVALLGSCVSLPKPPPTKPPLPYGFNSQTKRSLAQHLAKAQTAWDSLNASSQNNAGRARAEAAYQDALNDFLRGWSRRQLPKAWQNRSVFDDGAQSFVVEFQQPPGSAKEVSPQLLDRLLLADQILVPHRATRAQQSGIGIPIVGHVAHSTRNAAQQAAMPPNGAYLTLTAVLDFDGQPGDEPRRCHLHFYNPLQVQQTSLGGARRPIAANYTVAKHLALNDPYVDSMSVPGLLSPAKTLETSGLYCLDPYDAKKIPIVFVHGLLSDPHIWFHIINGIYADPELRAQYQPWYFLYPTGLAIPHTANLLRQSLQHIRERLDPDHNDFGMNHMVLVGHSMGGLLSRMQTIDSRDDFWRAYFTCTPEELKMTNEERAQLVSSLRFEKQPYVRRLIFIAVPHKGCQIAQYGIVYRASAIIRLPVDLARLTKNIITGNDNALAPQIREWGAFSFLGLGTLSPKHPYLHALNAQPIPVPHHSIIARLFTSSPGKGSDGAVRYESCHLDTGTELVVRSWHNCARKPAVIAEVLQRLRQHVRESR